MYKVYTFVPLNLVVTLEESDRSHINQPLKLIYRNIWPRNILLKTTIFLEISETFSLVVTETPKKETQQLFNAETSILLLGFQVSGQSVEIENRDWKELRQSIEIWR